MTHVTIHVTLRIVLNKSSDALVAPGYRSHFKITARTISGEIATGLSQLS